MATTNNHIDVITQKCIEWEAAKSSGEVDQIIAWFNKYHNTKYSEFENMLDGAIEAKGTNWQNFSDYQEELIEYGDTLCSSPGHGGEIIGEDICQILPQSRIITLPDKDAFRWLLLNLLGHDFYHDYNGINSRVKAIKNDVFAELEVLLQNYHFYEMTIKDNINGLLKTTYVSFLKNIAFVGKGKDQTVMYGGGGGNGKGSQIQQPDEGDIEEDPKKKKEKEMKRTLL